MKYVLLLKRLFMSLVTALLVSLLCFAIMYAAPGDPAEMMLRHKDPTGGLNDKTVEMYAEKLGTDRSFFDQYFSWLDAAVRGDLGTSYKTGEPVFYEFNSRIGCTILLMVFSLLIALITGLLLGMLSARYHNGVLDRITRFLTVFNMSVPSFWLSLLALWTFSVQFKLLPSFGYEGPSSLILPSFVQGISYSGTFLRVTRTCAFDSLSSGYVMTARAKGMGEFSVLVRHVLKNIMIPVLTILGGSIASMIGGNVIIENIFGLPGIGNYLVSAIMIKDFPVILGFLFILGLIVIVVNLIIDYIYTLLDPRVRQAGNER